MHGRGESARSHQETFIGGRSSGIGTVHQNFRPKDDSDHGGGTSFRGKKRKNDTHESTTAPECRLVRKGRGKEARLAYQGNVLVENRNGLVVGAEVAIGDGLAETEGALRLLERVPGNHRVTRWLPS